MQAVAEAAPQVRAVGLIRVSEVAGRDGESFASPRDQRGAIERVCAQRGWVLTDVFEELDVSAYKRPLLERPGLREAVRQIEAGQARVVVACYFDRLFRQIDVQRQVLKRVEAAGGEVYAADIGEVSHRTASRKLTATMLGAIAEYYAELVREKTLPAKERAVARGVAPYPVIVAGYRRGATGQIEVDPDAAPLVKRAFELRADGATITAVRDFLRESGVHVPGLKKPHTAQPIDHQRTRTLLSSRFVLGELRHGTFVNLSSHPAIVERELWRRVQQQKVPRGRPPKSERLLARLGVLRCATCNRPLSVGGYFSRYTGVRTATYRCIQPDRSCPAPAQINATVIEEEVVARVREQLEAETESASIEANVAEAELELARRQALLDASIAAFDGVEVASARQRLLDLQAAVQEAAETASRLRAAAAPTLTVNASRNWDGPGGLTIDERRALILATLRSVIVRPGRGAGRFEFEFRR